MNEADLIILRDEIVNDPAARGYKLTDDTWTGGANVPRPDQDIADLVNEQLFTVDAESIPMEEARAATTYEAYNDLAIDEQEYLRWVTPNGGALRITADAKLQLTGRIPAAAGVAGTGSDNASWWSVSTRAVVAAAFLALIELPGGRSDILYRQGRVVTAGDVGDAFNLLP